MDRANSIEAPANLDNDKSYYEVPSNCYEFKKKINGGQTLIVKDKNLKNFRKYKSGDNETAFLCCGCYKKFQIEITAYFINGIVKAPLLHACDAIPLEIKNIKIEENHETSDTTIPSSSFAGMPGPSTSNSNAITCENLLSNYVDHPNPPLSQELDDENQLENEGSTPSKGKVQKLKRGTAFRTVGPNDYEKGYSLAGNEGRRLIVFEENNRKYVKQYAGISTNVWFCLGCYKNKKKRVQAFNDNEDKIVVPKKHCCKSITYERAKEIQQEIIEKSRNNKNESVVGIAENEKEPNSSHQCTVKSRSGSPLAPLLSSQSKSKYYLRKRNRSQVAQNALLDRSKSGDSISSSVSSPSMTPPPKLTPIYFGARLSRSPSASLPSSPIPTSSKTLLYHRQSTPYPPSGKGKKRKLGQSKKNSVAEKSKPIENDLGCNNSDALGENGKDNSSLISQSTNPVNSYVFKPRSVFPASLKNDKNELHTLDNSSSSSNSPRLLPPALSSVYNISSKPQSTNSPFIKSFVTISSKKIPSSTSPSTTVSNPANSFMPLSSATPPPTSSISIIPPPSILSSTIQSTSIQQITNILFNNPSEYFLKKCCEKLGVDYIHEAYQFWSNIKISKFTTSSIPDRLYSTREMKYCGFECLSLYFTGDETLTRHIRENINRHIYYQNTETSFLNRDEESKVLFSKIVTERHFGLIASWLQCRIAVYCDSQWKRYGNWDAVDPDIPLLLMSFENERFSLVLSLK